MEQARLAGVTFIQKDDKYLLLKREPNDSYMPGAWNLPGGCCDVAKSIEEEATREAKEETGLDIKNPELLTTFTIAGGKPHLYFVDVVYLAKEWEGEIKMDHEHTEYKWVTIEEIEKMDVIPATKKALETLKNKLNK